MALINHKYFIEFQIIKKKNSRVDRKICVHEYLYNMSDSRACEIRLLTWLHDDFLSGDVESRDDKSSSTSEPPFARVQWWRISAGCFVSCSQGRDLSSGTRSLFTERTLKEWTRIASVLRVASVFPQLDISSVFTSSSFWLSDRRRAWKRISRHTTKRGRSGGTLRRCSTASLIDGIPF